MKVDLYREKPWITVNLGILDNSEMTARPRQQHCSAGRSRIRALVHGNKGRHAMNWELFYTPLGNAKITVREPFHSEFNPTPSGLTEIRSWQTVTVSGRSVGTLVSDERESNDGIMQPVRGSRTLHLCTALRNNAIALADDDLDTVVADALRAHWPGGE